MVPLSVLKAFNENICPHHDWIEFKQQQNSNNNDFFWMKLQILAILTQFWPVSGPKWSQYHCSKLSMNTVDPIVTGLSEIIGKILIHIFG